MGKEVCEMKKKIKQGKLFNSSCQDAKGDRIDCQYDADRDSSTHD